MNDKTSKGGKRGSGGGGGAPFPGDEIGRRLNALYRSIEDQPVPARIMDLLEQLERAERGTEGAAE